MSSRDKIKDKIIEQFIFGIKILMFHTSAKIEVRGMEIKKPEAMESLSLCYNKWYTQILPVITQFAPDRLNDFISLYSYKNSRKILTYENYRIYDYINGKLCQGDLKLSEGIFEGLFNQQISILAAVNERFDSILANIKGLLQAEMFDDELEAAKHLHNKMFYRASGMLSGVVLERHLLDVCKSHGLTIPLKPTISNYNELLKNNHIIDLPTWRYLSLLGDYRNICSHGKEREPTIDESKELLEGVAKIIKKVY